MSFRDNNIINIFDHENHALENKHTGNNQTMAQGWPMSHFVLIWKLENSELPAIKNWFYFREQKYAMRKIVRQLVDKLSQHMNNDLLKINR